MNTLKKMAASIAAIAVGMVSVSSFAFSAEAAIEVTNEPPYTAYLAVSAGANPQQWDLGDLEGEAATFNGDGSYSASVVLPAGSGSIECLILETNINAYAFCEAEKDPITEGTAKIVIDSVKVAHADGTTTEIPFTPEDGAFRTADDGKKLRYSIRDQWGAGAHTSCIEPEVPGGIGENESIVVDFTISGINAGGGFADDDNNGGDNNGGNGGGNNDDNNGGNGGAGNSTTAAGDNNSGATTTTTAAAGGNNGGNSNSNSNSSSNSSSNKNNSSSNKNNTSGNNATTSQTGDFGIAAVVLGAVATAALGVGAFTVTRRKK